jgi:hypothetical protein
MRLVSSQIFFVVILGVGMPTFGKEPLASGSFVMETSTNTLSADQDLEYTGAYLVGLKINLPRVYDFKQNLSVRLGYAAAYTHSFEGDRQGDFIDPRLSYGLNFGDRGIFKERTIGVGGLIPVNKETRNTSAVISFGPSFSYVFDMGKISLKQAWGYRRTWYEYDTDPVGRMNFPDTFSFLNELEWLVAKAWTLGLEALYTYAIDYNSVDKSSTEVSATVGWKITKNFSTALGVTTRSGTLAPTGDYHRINIYDPNRGFAFWDLALTF